MRYSSWFTHGTKLHGASFALLCHQVDNECKTGRVIIMTPWLWSGVDWPSGVPGLFPVGRSLTGRWTAIFYFIFIYLFIYLTFFSMPRLALVTIVTLPAGERHASAWPTVLSRRHSREVTTGPVACLSKEYLAQWAYEGLQRPRSPTHACSRPPLSNHF